MFLELQLELGSPLCPWLRRSEDRMDIFRINCPQNFLHPETEVQEEKGEEMKVTSGQSNAAYSRPLPTPFIVTGPTSISLGRWTFSALPMHATVHDRAKDTVWRWSDYFTCIRPSVPSSTKRRESVTYLCPFLTEKGQLLSISV